MRRFENQDFDNFVDRPRLLFPRPRLFESVAFKCCQFFGCHLSISCNPRLRTTVRNVSIEDCVATECGVGPARMEDVFVDTLKCAGRWGLVIECAVFKHVTLRGRIGRINVSCFVGGHGYTHRRPSELDRENRQFYEGVDWALDISQAEFVDVTICGVPAELIVRDPQSQVLVRKERAMSVNWQDVELCWPEYWARQLSDLAKKPIPSAVLIAPKRSSKFRGLMEDLDVFRRIGLADRD